MILRKIVIITWKREEIKGTVHALHAYIRENFTQIQQSKNKNCAGYNIKKELLQQKAPKKKKT